MALLPLLLLLYVLYRRWHRRAIRRIGNPQLVTGLLKGYAPARATLKFAALFIAFALGIVALANPQTEGEAEPDNRTGIDLVLAIDVSKSMLATDVAPSRLAAAKALLLQLLKDRPNDRVGLVPFAGHAYAQLPLTLDHSNAELLINAVDPQAFTAQGTAIADALQTGKEMLGISSGRYKTVLLLSDGETFDGNSEEGNALEQAERLAAAGITVFTVGFGSATGTTIIDPLTRTEKKDRQGNTVISKLDESLLKTIAQKTAGRYTPYTEAKATGKMLTQHLSTIKETALADKSLVSFQTRYFWVVVPMLLLLVVELFIPDRKKNSA